MKGLQNFNDFRVEVVIAVILLLHNVASSGTPTPTESQANPAASHTGSVAEGNDTSFTQGKINVQRASRQLQYVTGALRTMGCIPKFFCAMNSKPPTTATTAWNDLTYLIRFAMVDETSGETKGRYDFDDIRPTSDEERKLESLAEEQLLQQDPDPAYLNYMKHDMKHKMSRKFEGKLDPESLDAILHGLFKEGGGIDKDTKSSQSSSIFSKLKNVFTWGRKGAQQPVGRRRGKSFWETKSFHKQMEKAARIGQGEGDTVKDEECSATFNLCPYTVNEMKGMVLGEVETKHGTASTTTERSIVSSTNRSSYKPLSRIRHKQKTSSVHKAKTDSSEDSDDTLFDDEEEEDRPLNDLNELIQTRLNATRENSKMSRDSILSTREGKSGEKFVEHLKNYFQRFTRRKKPPRGDGPKIRFEGLEDDETSEEASDEQTPQRFSDGEENSEESEEKQQRPTKTKAKAKKKPKIKSTTTPKPKPTKKSSTNSTVSAPLVKKEFQAVQTVWGPSVIGVKANTTAEESSRNVTKGLYNTFSYKPGNNDSEAPPPPASPPKNLRRKKPIDYNTESEDLSDEQDGDYELPYNRRKPIKSSSKDPWQQSFAFHPTTETPVYFENNDYEYEPVVTVAPKKKFPQFPKYTSVPSKPKRKQATNRPFVNGEFNSPYHNPVKNESEEVYSIPSPWGTVRLTTTKKPKFFSTTRKSVKNSMESLLSYIHVSKPKVPNDETKLLDYESTENDNESHYNDNEGHEESYEKDSFREKEKDAWSPPSTNKKWKKTKNATAHPFTPFTPHMETPHRDMTSQNHNYNSPILPGFPLPQLPNPVGLFNGPQFPHFSADQHSLYQQPNLGSVEDGYVPHHHMPPGPQVPPPIPFAFSPYRSALSTLQERSQNATMNARLQPPYKRKHTESPNIGSGANSHKTTRSRPAGLNSQGSHFNHQPTNRRTTVSSQGGSSKSFNRDRGHSSERFSIRDSDNDDHRHNNPFSEGSSSEEEKVARDKSTTRNRPQQRFRRPQSSPTRFSPHPNKPVSSEEDDFTSRRKSGLYKPTGSFVHGASRDEQNPFFPFLPLRNSFPFQEGNYHRPSESRPPFQWEQPPPMFHQFGK